MSKLNESVNNGFIMSISRRYFHQTLKKYIPILTWLPGYSLQDLKGDFIAGFTVGLTVVPQGLALAHLANLPPQYGLYTAFMGSYMYSIFGTCKDLVIGPTSVMALMTAEYASIGGPVYASLLTFFCGCFQILLGILNLGCLMNYISSPVLSGFTSAAAIITATTQIKGIFGLKYQARGFLNTVYHFFLNISKTNLYDMTMGITSVFMLLLLRKFKDKKCTTCMWLLNSRTLQAAWWSIATARNALLVIICSFLASVCLSLGFDVLTLTQHVDAGLPHFQLPKFYLNYFDPTLNKTMCKTSVEVFQDLGTGVIVIPFLSLLEAVAIAKTFRMGNLMGSFVSSYPVTGSFSRSVINNASGVRTPLGGIISGTFVLLALCVIAPLFHYIPKSCLSAIIFSAVIFMIHYEDVPAMWKTNKVELIPFLTTFICSFALGLEYGLLFGVAVALAILLYKQNKPNTTVSIKKNDDGYTFIHVYPESSIYFPSSDRFKGIVSKALLNVPDRSKCTVIIHGNNLKEIDYTTAMGIQNMVKSMKAESTEVILWLTDPECIDALSCLEDYIYICKQDDELQDILNTAVTTYNEDSSPENESVEIASAETLLAKSVSSNDVHCTISKDNDFKQNLHADSNVVSC
ncbi:sodium-independent sulfate anion transporter-like isoform X2 [Stegodyphus dumicola]|uniref:sodium-independent sulfate anion transporter-like isoform X2 n=1 Tax=Stegodyphus dumicola TaxID=202533 RepID=UPI0015B07C35|nr:sodium-independent sulfate anion transporter-like isoform X2 [Stegodyphus dumicola]